MRIQLKLIRSQVEDNSPLKRRNKFYKERVRQTPLKLGLYQHNQISPTKYFSPPQNLTHIGINTKALTEISTLLSRFCCLYSILAMHYNIVLKVSKVTKYNTEVSLRDAFKFNNRNCSNSFDNLYDIIE